jgi:hypothetical protein
MSRVFAGPYHVACGFVGTAAWSYRDFQDKRSTTATMRTASRTPTSSATRSPRSNGKHTATESTTCAYVQALDRAIAAAKDASSPAVLAAKDLRRRQLESMQHPSWQHICGVNPATSTDPAVKPPTRSSRCGRRMLMIKG